MQVETIECKLIDGTSISGQLERPFLEHRMQQGEDRRGQGVCASFGSDLLRCV